MTKQELPARAWRARRKRFIRRHLWLYRLAISGVAAVLLIAFACGAYQLWDVPVAKGVALLTLIMTAYLTDYICESWRR